MIDLNNLNKEQKQAITTTEGPVLVVAGAGTGKTKVLTTRIAYLVSEMGFNQNNILALTFTNKAAEEMRNRLSKMLPNVFFPWVNTFHGTCLRILREDINYLNRSKNFSIIDDEDQLSLVKEIYKINDIEQKTLKPKKVLSIIDFLKINEINYKDIINLEFVHKFELVRFEDLHIIQLVYKKYETRLIEQNLLDFNDLLILTKKILTNFNEVKQKWQNAFKYVLVDEFQDTSLIQFEILKLLVNKQNNVFVVGDPDQTIYTWRGATETITDEFIDQFENAKIIILKQNYRSTKSIIAGSNSLIDKNDNRIKKQLETNNKIGTKIHYYEASSQDDESEFVAEKIKDLISNDYKYSDIVILYRANNLSRNIEQSLIQNNIPYFIFGGYKFYQRKEIKDILAYLKLIVFDDEIALKRVCDVPKRKISELTIEKINKYTFENNIQFFEAFRNINKISNINASTKEICNNFLKLIDLLRKESKNLSISKTIKLIIEKTKYEEYLQSLDFNSRIDNINELINSVVQFEMANQNSSIEKYLQEISLYTSIDDKRKNDNSVSLMTVHVAKGLEFKNVFIIGLNEGVFPSSQSLYRNKNMLEERRIAYVAMTRAMENLYISSSNGYNATMNSNMSPSRFISEIGEENLEIMERKYKIISDKKLEWFDSKKNTDYSLNYLENKYDFKIGDTIVHTTFGSGIIIGINNDFLEILFKSPYGTKSILKTHRSIRLLKS